MPFSTETSEMVAKAVAEGRWDLLYVSSALRHPRFAAVAKLEPDPARGIHDTVPRHLVSIFRLSTEGAF